jgi:hypothetical protein
MRTSRRPSCTPTYPIGAAASCTTALILTREEAEKETTMHTLTLILSAGGVGYLMVKAGLVKNGLELRRPRRICPSCGRVITGRRCDAH